MHFVHRLVGVFHLAHYSLVALNDQVELVVLSLSKTYHQLVVLVGLLVKLLFLHVDRLILNLLVLLANQLPLNIIQRLIRLRRLVHPTLLNFLHVL